MQVKVVFTSAGSRFLSAGDAYAPEALAAWQRLEAPLPTLYQDADEWSKYTTVHADPVLHIEVRTVLARGAPARRARILPARPRCSFASGQTLWSSHRCQRTRLPR
ncbi:hypothetical protein EON62_01545 [archaeon]|nr:MAG: hypothetical protein EON62_01545 [archaeon]